MVNKDKMKFDLKKYNIEFNEESNVYSKLFFVTNSDSYKLEHFDDDIATHHFKDFIVKGDIAAGISEGDTIEIELIKQNSEECSFIIRNKTKGTENIISIIAEFFYRLNERDFYKEIGMFIGLVLKEKDLHNIKVHYRLRFTEKECVRFIDGLISSNNEETALEHINYPYDYYNTATDYRDGDVLLLYTPYELNKILENKSKIETILENNNLKIKGLFYSKCDLELERFFDEPDEVGEMYSSFLPSNSLCIDVAKCIKNTTDADDDDYYYDNSPDLAFAAIIEINRLLDMKPMIYSGYDYKPIGKDREYLQEGEDFIFIKGFDKSNLLFPDMYKYPKRYLGNFKKNVETFHFCFDIHPTYEMWSYRVSDSIVNVYLYDCDLETNKKNITRFVVDSSIFSEEYIDFIAESFYGECEDYDNGLSYKKILTRCRTAYTKQSFAVTVACFVALFTKLKLSNPNFIEFDEDFEAYEDYSERVAINDFINKNVKVQAIFSGEIPEEERYLFEGPTYERIRYRQNEIALMENKR